MPGWSKYRDQFGDEVQIDHLSKVIGRYNLTVGVSKRSRDLKERVDSVLVPSSGTLIKRALTEVAQGKVKIIPAGEEKAEEESEELTSGAAKAIGAGRRK